jgi:Uma2 family endonuclease
MSTIMTPIPVAFQPPTLPVYRLSVDQYHQMIQNGTLTEDDPVELLEGLIVLKMPCSPRHDSRTMLASQVIQAQLPDSWRFRVKSAVTLGDSEPEPDIAVVEGPATRYYDHHPTAQEIALLVEVSDSSLARDQQKKARIYARASIGIYSIINLVDRQVEVYTDPTGPEPNPRYRQRQDYGVADSVPLVIEGNEVARIAVSALLP